MSDDEHWAKALALSDKIAGRAESTLDDLKWEMEARKWPPEFRKILWEAVAQVATAYAEQLTSGGDVDTTTV